MATILPRNDGNGERCEVLSAPSTLESPSPPSPRKRLVRNFSYPSLAPRHQTGLHPAFRAPTEAVNHDAGAEAPILSESAVAAIRRSTAMPSTALTPARIKYLQDPVCRAEIKSGKTLIKVNTEDLVAEIDAMSAKFADISARYGALDDNMDDDADITTVYSIYRREETEGADISIKGYHWKRIKGIYNAKEKANAAAQQELYSSELAVRYPGRIAQNNFETEGGEKDNSMMAYRLRIAHAGLVETMVHPMRTQA
ncbi:hypothetical protein DOTSEDRAFT_24342 [Dothistroma septosporum NZE10]|uniref:Uncharacterized protein n=1 Tax=Dothistroma septosporum (strain NZE10 / CBS 128990) TaxID=675120 RepID=N1PPA4_DOTSN|nr:hypothetical protein DOTSEDRAFT_24342 [Dothistroma septosporum NZE10]